MLDTIIENKELLHLAILAIIVVLITALALSFKIRRKISRVRALNAMDDSAFVEDIQRRHNLPPEYITKLRRRLGREHGVPYKKIKPDDTIESLENCMLFPNVHENSVDYLVEDLYYSDNPRYKKKIIDLETVADYIYYSAILDKILLVFP